MPLSRRGRLRTDTGQLLDHVDPARRVDVHLHQLVADDVEADEVHAVADQLRCHQFRQAQCVGIRHRHFVLAARADVAARIAAVVVAADAGIGAVDLERAPVEHQQAQVTVLGLGQILLGDRVPVAGHRVDHLVEVAAAVGCDDENALAAGALQGLDDAVALARFDEGLDLVGIATDAGDRSHFFGEVLEIGLVRRVGEMRGVVDHQRAAQGHQLREQQATGRCPGTFDHFVGRIAAQHQHVELVDRNAFGHAVGRLDVGQQRGVIRVVGTARPPCTGTDDAAGVVSEVGQPHQRDFVPAGDRLPRQADGGVVVLLGGDVVDDEAQAHRGARFGHAVCSVGRCVWKRRSTGVRRQTSSRLPKSSAAA